MNFPTNAFSNTTLCTIPHQIVQNCVEVTKTWRSGNPRHTCCRSIVYNPALLLMRCSEQTLAPWGVSSSSWDNLAFLPQSMESPAPQPEDFGQWQTRMQSRKMKTQNSKTRISPSYRILPRSAVKTPRRCNLLKTTAPKCNFPIGCTKKLKKECNGETLHPQIAKGSWQKRAWKCVESNPVATQTSLCSVTIRDETTLQKTELILRHSSFQGWKGEQDNKEIQQASSFGPKTPHAAQPDASKPMTARIRYSTLWPPAWSRKATAWMSASGSGMQWQMARVHHVSNTYMRTERGFAEMSLAERAPSTGLKKEGGPWILISVTILAFGKSWTKRTSRTKKRK